MRDASHVTPRGSLGVGPAGLELTPAQDKRGRPDRHSLGTMRVLEPRCTRVTVSVTRIIVSQSSRAILTFRKRSV